MNSKHVWTRGKNSEDTFEELMFMRTLSFMPLMAYRGQIDKEARWKKFRLRCLALKHRQPVLSAMLEPFAFTSPGAEPGGELAYGSRFTRSWHAQFFRKVVPQPSRAGCLCAAGLGGQRLAEAVTVEAEARAADPENVAGADGRWRHDAQRLGELPEEGAVGTATIF